MSIELISNSWTALNGKIVRKYPGKNGKFWTGVLKKAEYALTADEFEKHINNITTNMPLS